MLPPASLPPRSAPTGWHLLNTIVCTVALSVVLAPLWYWLLTATGLLTSLPDVRTSCGDSALEWLGLRLGLYWGLAVGVTLAGAQVLRRTAWPALPAVLLDIIALYLSLTLFSYGFSKVFASQFPHLWANQDTPPGELTPMRVAWQFFGYSRAYQQFLGWGEVLPAMLLLWRRTRTLGALVAAIVMLNVFVINLCFDVCVKIGSGTYLVLALVLLAQDTDRLWQFLVLHRPAALRSLPATAGRFSKRGRIVYRVLGGVLTLAMLYFTWDSMQQAQAYATSQEKVLPVTGVWETTRAARWTDGSWQSITPADSSFPTRVYFQAAQAVLRNAIRRDRFMAAPDSAHPDAAVQLTARNENNDFAPPLTWQFRRFPSDSLQLQGRWHRDSLRLTLRLRRELMR
ncbi:hypothetical protein [Hymenobacter pini]|uniref:hypothetical protein n=1 Tax=Hymenobacter pini TaxID=2880879 RepID=UPI001CF4CB0C|nr:hypothetical protein [Hymenobacter pini]MCA8830761.1 hypothetical protein [Hymenobacter pini]